MKNFVYLIFAYWIISVAAPAQAQLSWRIPTPWGDWNGSVDPLIVLTNPESYINPTGIPSSKDLVQFAVQNPEKLYELINNPHNTPYWPIASAITAGRNAILVNGTRPIPPHIRNALAPWYSSQLFDSIRWSTNWSVIQNVPQAAQFVRQSDTKAITLINAILFRDSSSADNIGTWAHELYHAQQYRDWGVLGFAERWVNNSSDSGPLESPAYDQEASVISTLNARGDQTYQPIATDARCREENASTAYCDLWAANNRTSARFFVSGIAHATGNGTRSGRMRFVMFADGKLCNPNGKVEYGVDNATELKGDGFTCVIDVASGRTVRVTMIAPNYRADAKFTRATATHD